jgi:AcrR family transcriptional regulator
LTVSNKLLTIVFMKSTKRKPTVDRREEIVEAVLHIIGQRGLRSLTTTTLAAEVGVTTGALYRHFASMDDILTETVRHGVEKIEGTFPPSDLAPMERILSLARGRVEVLGSSPGLTWLLRSEQAFLTLPAPAVKHLREVVSRSRRFILEALHQGMDDGSIRHDIAAEILMVPVMATIHAVIGLQAQQTMKTEKMVPEPRAVLEALERLLEPFESPSRLRSAASPATAEQSNESNKES